MVPRHAPEMMSSEFPKERALHTLLEAAEVKVDDGADVDRLGILRVVTPDEGIDGIKDDVVIITLLGALRISFVRGIVDDGKLQRKKNIDKMSN
eukprot:10876628-Ditylum_brightwellii.AAC.1